MTVNAPADDVRMAGDAAAIRLKVGYSIPVRRFETISGRSIDVSTLSRPVHIQFRRFAGCPVCTIHLREFVRRQAELRAHFHEIIIFHSSRQDLLAYSGDLPFDIVADPHKRIYAAFGVEASPRALLDMRAWPTIVRAIASSLPDVLTGRRPMPPLFPSGGRYGLPADFLVNPAGRVLAAKYGVHADDQWSVDEVIRFANAGLPASDEVRRAAGADSSAARVS
ncbi:MAG TPA: AhpC/TSA family protein [Bauldia sp.]|nr:AhpC/TSA family protein [Bauldia sp.]